jgi:plasmid stabilization system protein ParE
LGKVWRVRARFTKRAIAQVAAALDYIAARSPQGAENIRKRLIATIAALEVHPQIGRATDRPGVRRIAISPYPYLIDYRVTAAEVIVMRFRHAARRDAAD